MADEVADLVTILDSNWDNSNTGSVTPSIRAITEVKRTALGGGDFVFCYQITEILTPADQGFLSYTKNTRLRIDIRTTTSRTRLIEDRDEAIRTINLERKARNFSYDRLEITEQKDLSDRSRKLYRWTIDVNFIRDFEDITI